MMVEYTRQKVALVGMIPVGHMQTCELGSVLPLVSLQCEYEI